MSDSSEKKKNELDRRAFLKKMLTGAGVVTAFPGEIFLSNMIMQFIQKGYAQAAGLEDGLSDMKLVNLSISGGISRWYWDGILTPNGSSDIFDPNPMVISKFKKSGNDIIGEYATTRIGDYYLPWTWAANIPTSGGGSVPMSMLAQNMLSLRGINTLIDSHGINRQRHIATTPGGTSITGLLADKSKSPIPAIHRNLSSNFYGSEKGNAVIDVDGVNPFTTALSPFLPTNGITGLKSDQIENAIDLALAKMSNLSAEKHKFLPSSYQARNNAKVLMKKQFGNLQQNFNSLRDKYLALMRRSCSRESALALSGVDDLIIEGSQSSPYLISGSDYFNGSNLNDIIKETSYISGLAESLAVAEFMIKENLSSAFSLGIAGLMDTRCTSSISAVTGLTSGDRNFLYAVDAHYLGSHAALVVYSRYYRALSAALYEFIQQLKSVSTPKGNLFNQTAITITSEFNRTPLLSGAGADHGWQGANYTVFSGMVDKLTVLGNVKSMDSTRYGGTWGMAGSVSELGGREAILGNCLTTVSEMVEVQTPMPNDRGFVAKKNGKIVPVISSCKNIDKKGVA